MALSEHEQYVIDQMEQALSATDPRFVAHMARTRQSWRRHLRVALNVLALAAGLLLVLLGVWLVTVWVSVLGFLVVVTGLVCVIRLRTTHRR
ncbi:hypothetical protein N864_21520 [Intrasporangium chromatireducens Q5-1]|uniref:DUF3040 domain-containing protein n=1 Tax=Intrasporangium chromatireducens Q5-1 TaxID=584657 RepID=W9GJJ3_9MICO|nr:hypothetical protein N864_21520 [Intrasporangium chromatireducens Q5-1]